MATRYEMTPIGTIRTPHTEPGKTPIQPVFARGIAGRVELDPELEPALDDIEDFSYVYLLYVLHRAGEPRLHVTPFLEDEERGLFATRAPARPNPIGLSLVRVLSREGPVLHVADVDMLDGTPLLDIKPFTRRFDERPDAEDGWQDALDEDSVERRGRRGCGLPTGDGS
ncbi:MAG: tRNA (N6-threonylcarbamoyladenosine(37)-N6)-methyltransferase TrmO [Candidatus Eisenbacteria bacterium]|nr:tRNA (N6-threonylcarbamoyladenosine(37)-N6)-methyltransferase TrmO [Candidatus Eisenbacteria bacterium]